MSPLNALQRRGLLRLGDVVIPGDQGLGLPRFSDAGVAAHVDRMLPWMYDADRASVLGVLTACAVLPKVVIRGLMEATERGSGIPGVIGTALRMAGIGTKGLVVSLYYSGLDEGHRIRTAIKYDSQITPRPQDPDRSLPRGEQT